MKRAIRSALLLAASMACSRPAAKVHPQDGATADAEIPDAAAAAPPTCTGCTVIRHVTVVDAEGIRRDRRVAIQGSSILFDLPDQGSVLGASTEIDGTDHSLLPGLWDMHVHLGVSGGPRGQLFAPDLAAHLMGYLAWGVTSIFDMGSERDTIIGLRDRIRAGGLLAPHLRAVGPLLTAPGGHPCIFDYDPSSCGLVDGDASAEKLIADLEPLHPDLVKLVIEGGIPPLGSIPRVSSSNVRAVVDAAHRHGLKVISHVSRTQDAVDAVAGGVVAFAHIPVEEPLPDPLLDSIASARIAVVSTIVVYEATGHFIDDPSYLDDPKIVATVEPAVLQADRDPMLRMRYDTPAGQTFVADFRAYADQAAKNLMRLKTRNIAVLAGSDAGNFYVFHGPGLHRELALMVKAGLTPKEAIESATLLPARFAGVDTHEGLVKAGYDADLLLAAGDVSVDINAISNVERVFLAGQPIDRAALGPNASPHSIVRTPAGSDTGGTCIEDADCKTGDACDSLSALCAKTCNAQDANACPASHGCLQFDPASLGECALSSGCNPLLQDCPFKGVYHSTCTPFSATYTYCAAGGTRTEGQSCDPFTNPCAQGLYCGLGALCYQLCDPHGTALPPCSAGRHCTNLMSEWGQPFGLCTR